MAYQYASNKKTDFNVSRLIIYSGGEIEMQIYNLMLWNKIKKYIFVFVVAAILPP